MHEYLTFEGMKSRASFCACCKASADCHATDLELSPSPITNVFEVFLLLQWNLHHFENPICRVLKRENPLERKNLETLFRNAIAKACRSSSLRPPVNLFPSAVIAEFLLWGLYQKPFSNANPARNSTKFKKKIAKKPKGSGKINFLEFLACIFWSEPKLDFYAPRTCLAGEHRI